MQVLEIALFGVFRVNDVIIRSWSGRILICREYIKRRGMKMNTPAI